MDTTLKYSLLDAFEKKEVSDFIDFLFSRKQHNKEETSGYQEQILSVTTWSDEDIKVFEENRKLFNKWRPTTW